MTGLALRRVLVPLVAGAALLAGLTATGGAATGARAPSGATAAGARMPGTQPGHIPVLAYYYIWFDKQSWETKKSDLPQLGKYSSDDVNVMRQHIEWAKSAGIDGFIVSWKHTPTLDARLAKLVDLAEQENFKLEIIYQGLDVNRNPLPGGAATVARDLDWFTWNYSQRAPFNLFPKPLVIWSGTWGFSASDIASVTTTRRNQLLILASERNVEGYNRVASSVDGNAYYWSSVNPTTYDGYAQKLVDMRNAVDTNGGLWIAPAAPGFDARRNQGTTVVPRDGGTTFDQEITAALNSKPDALGIISWNEFTENSHIEPSQSYGFRYLDVVAQRVGSGVPVPEVLPGGKTSVASSSDQVDGADSSSSPAHGFPTGLIVFPAFLIFFVVVLFVAGRRARRPSGPDGSGGGLWRPRGPRTPPAPGSRRARRQARQVQAFARLRRGSPAPASHTFGTTAQDKARPVLPGVPEQRRDRVR